MREPALQLLQLPEHDLRVVAALPKKLVSLPVEFIEDRISVHVGRYLVVIDEASQILTEDAIGAVMRGNQLVVAGDEKQLPPTSFFQASQVDDSDGDEEEDDSTEQPDYESVLAACSTVLLERIRKEPDFEGFYIRCPSPSMAESSSESPQAPPACASVPEQLPLR